MNKTSILIFTMISLVLFGCLASNQELATQISPKVDTIKTITIRAPISTASVIPTVISMDLPISTLNATESSFIVKQLLLQNDYCVTPCIWGIFPGKTTLKDAQFIFSNLGSPLIKTLQLDRQSFYASSFGPKSGLENGLSFQVILTVEDLYVKNMRAGVSLANYTLAPAHDEWTAYSPENVLKRYGVPSRVDFSLFYPAESGSPPNAAWYVMAIYFDDLDLIFEYGSDPLRPLTKEGNAVRVCPSTDPFAGVNIWLGKEPVYPPVIGLSLEEALTRTLTLSEFYNTLVVNSGCFELNSKVFAK